MFVDANIELPPRITFALPQIAATPLPTFLPDDPQFLKALLHSQYAAHSQAISATHEQALRHVQYLYEQIALYRQRLFGRSSEQLPEQSRLFDEAEALAAQDESDEQDQPQEDSGQSQNAPEAQAPLKKARGKRAPLPAELPRLDIIHDVPQSERVCPCGTPMVQIGEEISEQLDIVPMKIQVLRHIRKRYGCPDASHAPVTAALPAQPLPKTNASPNLLAMLLTVKYADGLPLARFEKVLARHGVVVPRQTLARWTIGAATMLQPLHNLARDELFEGPFVHVDETELQVLKEPGRAPDAKSYMWVQVGGPPDRPVVIYDYDASRSGQVPVRLLQGYKGYLMTDGYEGYNALARYPGIEHLACMAHARRKFVEAARVQAKGKRGRANEAIELISQLYRVERETRSLSDAQRLALRQTRSVPTLERLKTWLDKTAPAVPPSAALGKALAYLAHYWPKLIRYVERGDLPIDNNRAENAIRPFVVGRKAWMFSDTPAGANASALIYSLIETAKANGVEPHMWLTRVMQELPTAKTVDEIAALLPWNMHPAQ